MKVSELAKEYKTTTAVVLEALKSLKLKAKDGKQEISAAVLPVIKKQLVKEKGKTSSAKEDVVAVKKKSVKKVAKKKVSEKSSSKEKESKEDKVDKKAAKTVKKVVKKRVVKKKIVKRKAVAKNITDKKKEEDAKVEKVEEEKIKSKMSSAPVISLKPLARKRKKISREDKKSEKLNEKPLGFDSPEGVSELGSKLEVSDEEKSQEEEVEEKKENLAPYDASLSDLEIKVPITVKDLGVKLQQKPSVILKTLMKMGMFAHINQGIGADIVSRITKEYGFNLVKIRTQEEYLIEEHETQDEESEFLVQRAPVITFMGHVDHGKTSLLDKIRKAKVADDEHGGITQHMGAYSVSVAKGKITFLDTPGHEAFTSMRARGAHITDLVVLVVAADDGIMPQTREAIDHAKAANVPMIVALNKVDLPNADVERVKKQFADMDILPEDWGGKTVMCGVSAQTGEGIDNLLEMVLLESEMLELKANAKKNAAGIVVEAHLSQGKGAVTTLIVQSGTLKEGNLIVLGPNYGKIRAMFDDHGHAIKEAGPSMPVEVLGLPSVPDAGEKFYVVENEKQAKEITFRRQEEINNKKAGSEVKITLENLQDHLNEGAIKELNVVMKSDVQGSLEALKDSLEKIPSDKVKIKFIHLGVGDVNVSDVLLAHASKAIVIAFHVGIDSRAKKELEKDPVDIRQYRIIYDAVDDMRKALEGLLDVKIKKNFLSRIEIREVFKLSKHGIIAGCYVEKGKVRPKLHVDILRSEEVIHTGKISSLKRFKDDVKEVAEGMECGISIEGYTKYQAGDIIEAYDLEEIIQKL